MEQIQALKDFYKTKGFELSDAGVIQIAVSAYMDLAVHDLNKGNQSLSSKIQQIQKETEE